MTTKRAAKVAHCHTSTINKLIRAGKIKASNNGVKGKGIRYTIDQTASEVRDIVYKNSPRSGFHRNGKVSQKIDTFAPIFNFIKLGDKRDILIQIGNKFSKEELKLLLTL